MSRSPQKQKREPLSRGRIEDAAFELIEQDGLAGFSIRKLAAALHCEAMSIYHYFPSKGHILDALVDHVIGEMPPIPPPTLPWPERLQIVAREYRRVLTSRPGLFVYLATHRLNTRICLAWLDEVLGFFRESGLDDGESVRLFRSFGYYLMGAGLDETAGYARGPSTADPIPEDELRRDFPNVVAAGPHFQPSGWERTFETGLELLVNGISRKVEANNRGG